MPVLVFATTVMLTVPSGDVDFVPLMGALPPHPMLLPPMNISTAAIGTTSSKRRNCSRRFREKQKSTGSSARLREPPTAFRPAVVFGIRIVIATIDVPFACLTGAPKLHVTPVGKPEHDSSGI